MGSSWSFAVKSSLKISRLADELRESLKERERRERDRLTPPQTPPPAAADDGAATNVPPPPSPHPPYNPHQSKFNFPNHHLDFPRRSPPRVLDNQIQFSPFRTADNHRHDVDGSSKFRDDFIDGFKPNHDEEYSRNRIHRHRSDFEGSYRYASNSNGSSRNFAFGDSHVVPSRDFGSNVGNYESFRDFASDRDRIRGNRGENRRWVGHGRVPSRRLADAPVESENYDVGNRDKNRRWGHARAPSRNFSDAPVESINNDDRSPVVSSRRVPRIYDSGSKSNYRGSRERYQDPRKEIEKKSVLLRIQFRKSQSRHRNDYQRFPSANDSGPSNFRSRGPVVHTDNRMEGDREGTPVDLDVSFKSNALVAKAVVASSNQGVESNEDLTQRDRENRKLTGREKDLLNSSVTKHSDGPVEPKSFTYALEDSKLSGENSKDSGVAVCATGSQPCAGEAIDLPRNNTLNEPVSDKGGNTVGSDETSSHKIRKKNKKVVSFVLKSKAAKKKNDRIKVDSPLKASLLGEDLTEKSASADMVLVQNVDTQPFQNEVTALVEHNNVNDSPGAVVSEKDGSNIDSGGSHVRDCKRPRISSTHPFCSSSPVNISFDEGTATDRSVDLHAISNYDKGTVELQNGSTFTGTLVGHLCQQSFQKVAPVVLQNGLTEGYLEGKLSVRGMINAKLSSPEEIKIHGAPTNLYSTSHGVQNDSITDNGLNLGDLNITASGSDDVGAGSKFNEATALAESVEVEGSPMAVASVETNAIVSLSSAAETNVHDFGSNPYATTISGSDNAFSNSPWKFPVCEIGFHGDSKESFPDGASFFLENVPEEGPPKARMPVRDTLHVGLGKRKDRDIHSDLSSPTTSDMPEKAVTVVHPAHTTSSCPVKILNFTEDNVLGAGNVGAGSQPCTDEDTIVHMYSPTKDSFDNELSEKWGSRIGENGTSPNYIKNRKVCAPVSPSSMLSETQDECVNAGTCVFGVEEPSNNEADLMQSEDRVVVPNINAVCSSGFPPCLESNTVLFGNTEAGSLSEAVGLVGEDLTDSIHELEQESSCPSGLGGEQKAKGTLVVTILNHQLDIFDTELGGRAEKGAAANTVEDLGTVENLGMLHIETVQQRNPLETQVPDTDQRLPFTDMHFENGLVKNGFPSVSNTMSSYADDDSVSTSNLPDEIMESAPDKLSNMDSTETLSVVTGSHFVDSEITLGQILNDEGSEDVRKQDEKVVLEGLSLSNWLNTSLQNTTIEKKSGHAVEVSSINSKLGPQDARNTIQSMSGAVNMRKNQLTSAVPRVFPGHLSLKKTAPSSHIATARTWHRSGNPSASSHVGKNSYPHPVPPRGQLATKIGKDQTASYIRKGNSLVRKPSQVAANVSHALSSPVYRLNPMGTDEMKERTGVKRKTDLTNPPNCLRTGLDANLERPKTPGNGASSPLTDPLPNDGSETESEPFKLKEIMHVPKPSEDVPNNSGTHENLKGQANNLGSQSVQDDRNSVPTKSQKILYVKRKSNQLVASNSGDLSHQKADPEAPSSSGYYKRRKNQIIRKSSEISQKAGLPGDSLNSEGKSASNSIRRRSGKGLAKTYKPSKFSLVWTLRDAESLKKENTLIRQVWPQLFPWKRATYRRSLMHVSASTSNSSSLSTISRRLLLSRKRETIYTRSTRGYSLRKSKVLSVGGASLKWSKSIERKSKKANEEATLAVAAAEKKKREQNGAGGVTAGAKKRNHSSRKLVHSIELRPGERIFRVGSVRYKMDNTRRTLQRISDEELSNSVALQTGKGVNKSVVPKRLLIGNDEYVRIGNGNQLIRDPKKRIRNLASEKVRWSLHTARMKLARKKKYCQFFTRFGKCNKDNGKCPYIHDHSKIAVCTKFLKGSCSDVNCKLTHKVIPERMQDCSYFLQGLCTNESCPYRHVNVNPNASICDGFLRGYCADGNECRKKHSYVCPIFEATGICTQGSKCKLHHPKNRIKGKKRKNTSGEQKNARGRYFGSMQIDISESRTAVSEKHASKDNGDIFYQEGGFADYIHLDISDDEGGEMIVRVREQTTLCDGDPADTQLDGDELIKPILLMNRSLMTGSSAAFESPSEKTAGGISEEYSCKL